MATFELVPFQKTPHPIQIVSALDYHTPAQLQLGFWINDPEQVIVYPSPTPEQVGQRIDFLWEQTCFELFIGIKNADAYREINLSPNLTWQAYQFEEYRYPEDMPPQPADDIQLLDFKKTNFGLTAHFDLKDFLSQQQIRFGDLYFGISAVICTAQQQHFFALQHQQTADFHNKRNWIATL